MKTRLLRFGAREVVRHPGATFRYRRALMAAAGAAGQAHRYSTALSKTATDPKARAEARLAAASLLVAATRARQIGILEATNDKRVLGQLRHAQNHALRALATAQHRRRRQRIVRITVVAGAGVLGGAAYAGWRMRAQPQPAADDAPQPLPID